MKRWRYSVALKAAAAAANQILAVVFVLCLMILIMLFQKNILNFDQKKDVPFESSSFFTDQFEAVTQEVLEFSKLRGKFETDQVYDPDKEVDIWHYYERQELSGWKKREKNALLYRLGDLAEWSRGYSTSFYEFVAEYEVGNGIKQRQSIYRNGENVYSEEKPVLTMKDMAPELRDNVIEKVEYYYGGSYSTSGEAGAERMAYSESDGSGSGIASTETVIEHTFDEELQTVIQKVVKGQLYELDAQELELLLTSMDSMSYVSRSSAYDFIDEDYLPQNGGGIWERFMNGEISMEHMRNAYHALSYTVEEIGKEINQYRKCLNNYHQSPHGSNVYYWVSREKDGAVWTNMNTNKASALASYGSNLGKYLFYRESDIHLETNVSDMEEYFYKNIEPEYGNKGSVLFLGVDTKFPNADALQEAKAEYDKMYPWIRICLWGAGLSLLALLICFIYLSIVAGKRDDSGKVHLNLFDRIPTELLLLLAFVEIIAFVWGTGKAFFQYAGMGGNTMIMLAGGVAFVGMAFLMAFYLSFVRRIRAGVLWSGSILGWFFRGIGLLFTSRKSLTKMVIWFGLHLLACVFLLPMIAASYDQDIFILGVAMFSILCGGEAVLIIREGVQRNKVLDGIGRIASGNLEYKIAEGELRGDNRRLAQAVNAIGEGLYHAVDASMKNERLQADLITNVSHDIKTPLTSIINYVDLLKREKLDNERAQNYIAVLESKSQRLKQLAEDLVEASRISSGNIKLEMERINLVELVHQTEGEFTERFEARGLQVISNLPKESVVILADGRRIWRVLENLYNNVAKYAMEHTRVYVDMQADGSQVLFSIKNISENALNIPAEELTERFIRGDISRSTEGSGLGLSIAKNLMILMGGSFRIYLDGDLFKVMIGFKQEQSMENDLSAAAEKRNSSAYTP